mgnify:CR=1 FL=1
MKKALILLVFVATQMVAQTPQELFVLGNQAYANQNYTEALAHYTTIADSSWQSPALYFNMANSYYRLNQVGYAILYYEKANKLSPNDSHTVNSLTLTRTKITDKQFFF